MLDLPTVLREVDSWPVNDRIRLVQEVWDRLVEGGVEPGQATLRRPSSTAGSRIRAR